MAPHISPTAQRDNDLARVWRLRTACALGAAGVTALLAYLAAGSVPGRATASSTAGTTSSGAGASSQSQSQSQSGLQPPQQAPVAGGGGGQSQFTPVVSGGS